MNDYQYTKDTKSEVITSLRTRYFDSTHSAALFCAGYTDADSNLFVKIRYNRTNRLVIFEILEK